MRSIAILSVVLALTIVGSFIAWQQFKSGEISPSPELLTLLDKEVIAPSPLTGPAEPTAGRLTAEGILAETNQQRATEGLPPLTIHNELTQAAQAKAEDMFTHQYFDHVGPDGKGPSDWVEAAGYAYLAVGENLALGNFGSDAELVEAWMNSPGHRANIVSSKFTQIGIAAQRGTFKNNTTWIAVQTFALPAAACPASPDQLMTEFAAKQKTLEQRAQDLDKKRAELSALAANISSLASQGNEKVQAGNLEIEEGNRIYRETGDKEAARPHWETGEKLQAEGQALLEKAKSQQEKFTALQDSFNRDVAEYNQQSQALQKLTQEINRKVRAYNQCLKQ